MLARRPSALRLPLALAAVAALVAAVGCSTAHDARTYESIVAEGLVEPSLLPPPPPPERAEATLALSPWHVEDAKDFGDLGDKLARLLRERKTTMVAFGELYTPWWVPEYSAGAQLARFFLAKAAAATGAHDLVLEYLTQDVADAELRAFADGGAAPGAEMALQDFYAADLLKPARELHLALWKGGYTPSPDRRWSLDDLAVRGAPGGKTLRCNPHYVDITAEIKKNSLARLLKLRAEKRPAIWFGGAEVAELEDEVDFLSRCAFESDDIRYRATREAGAMGADLRALGIDREYACVFIVSAADIQHQGRLNEAQYERMWRLRRTHPRLVWRTVGDSVKVFLLLPWEQHRITNLENKVRTVSDEN
jgi:hypothetical protein